MKITEYLSGIAMWSIFLISLSSFLKAEELDDRSMPKVSPSGAFTCRILKGQQEVGNKVSLKDNETGRELFFYNSLRWVEMDWSPDSRWLVVTDHWDGHGANLHFFFVDGEIREGDEWKLPEIYATPWPTQYDCKWRFVKWELGEGAAKIECSYRSKSAGGGEVVRRYSIPLDYP